MLDEFALAGVVIVCALGYLAFIAWQAAQEAGGGFKRRADAAVARVRRDLSALAAGAASIAGEALGRIAPYARSRTNIVQALQYAGIALAAPLSAADLESWSTRAWLLIAGLLFVGGVLCRGPKHAPAGGPGAELDRAQPPAQTAPAAPRTFGSP